MEREWTNETRDAWIARRTARRKQRGKPEFLRDVSLEAERESVKEGMNDIVKRTISWEVRYASVCFLVSYVRIVVCYERSSLGILQDPTLLRFLESSCFH